MDNARDLGQVQLWEESLERSRARRARERTRSQRKPVELGRLGPVGLGGISAAALMAATLPSLLSGRGSSQHAQQVAFTVAPRPGGTVGGGIHQRLTARPATRPSAPRQEAAITTASARVMPSEHFVKTTPQPAVRVHTAATQSHSTAPAPVFLSATHSSTKHQSAHQGVAAAMLTRSQSSHHPEAHSKGSGGAGLGGSSHSSSHSRRPAHRSTGSSGSDSKSGNTRSGTTSHPSSSASHAATRSGGAGIGSPSGSGSGSGSGSNGYVNPLGHAKVTPERIDQGVDYSGSGNLGAIGDGKITYVGTSNTGWPGAFIEFKLLDGPDAGRYVYYAESIAPAQGLHVGEKVSAGQTIATINGGIEIGWGANVGTETYAMQHGQWGGSSDANNVATPAGKNFSSLIASLGGPPGKVEG